jgi:uncharacterized protein YukE
MVQRPTTTDDARVEVVAEMFNQLSVCVRIQKERLQKVSTAWTGDAAGAAADKINKAKAALTALEDGFEEARDALKRYVSAIDREVERINRTPVTSDITPGDPQMMTDLQRGLEAAERTLRKVDQQIPLAKPKGRKTGPFGIY